MTAELIDSAPALEMSRDVAHEYSVLVNAALDARKAMDLGRWLIGDYVRKLITDFSQYRECTIENFSDAIGIDPKRAYEYAAMASFYPLTIREELSELELTYTHFREARRLRTIDKAVEFLKAIALNRWTITQTRDALKTLQRMGHRDIAQTYSDAPPALDYHEAPVYPGSRNLSLGIASIKVSKQGVMLEGVALPDYIDPTKKYEVIFREVLED